jgi:hypothetical protein
LAIPSPVRHPPCKVGRNEHHGQEQRAKTKLRQPTE